MIAFGRDVAEYVGLKTGTTYHPPYSAIGRQVDGRIVAGAVFNTYTGWDIEISIAAEPGGITRRLLRAWGCYVLDVAGCGRVSITTQSEHVAELAIRLGGKREGLKRDAFGPGRDGITLGILKSEWRL